MNRQFFVGKVGFSQTHHFGAFVKDAMLIRMLHSPVVGDPSTCLVGSDLPLRFAILSRAVYCLLVGIIRVRSLGHSVVAWIRNTFSVTHVWREPELAVFQELACALARRGTL